MGSDVRYEYQTPKCTELQCGYTGVLRKAKIDKGCIRSDIILDDRGSLTYPRKTADNGRQVYNNKENCIWHVQAASANKWLKFKITYADFEYDQYCGLDKLHIFNGPIPKAGAWRNPVARICGGSDNRKKDRNGTAGPRRSMFHDGTTGLKRYSNPDCPRKKKGKGFRACKQEGWDNWVELGGNNFTFSFESDQSTQMTGFTIEWTTFDSPAPTPPPPDIQKMSPKYAQNAIASGLSGRSGLFRQVKIENAKKHAQQQIFRSRVFINWARLRDDIRDKDQNLASCRRMSLQQTESNAVLPQPIAERLRDQVNGAKSKFYQRKAKDMLELYNDILDWVFENCYGNKLNRNQFRHRIDRMIRMIYKR